MKKEPSEEEKELWEIEYLTTKKKKNKSIDRFGG